MARISRTPVGKNRIRYFRMMAGLSLEALGQRAGMHPSTVYKLETGKLRVKDDQFAALAHAMGCAVGDLLQEPGNPNDEVGRAIIILSRMTPEQRELWFQVGASFAEGKSHKS